MDFGAKRTWGLEPSKFQYKPKETKLETNPKELQSEDHIKKVTSLAKGLYYARDWLSTEDEESIILPFWNFQGIMKAIDEMSWQTLVKKVITNTKPEQTTCDAIWL